MNIMNCYNIDNIIRDLETAFQLDGSDYEERNLEIVLKNVKTRIGRQYQIDLLEHKIDATEFEIGVYRSQVVLYVENVARIHATLCGFCQIARYMTNIQVSLSSINYLGFTEDSLKVMLQALQRKITIMAAEDAVNSVKQKLGTITTCREKRLFMLIVVSYTLGFYEVTAAIAEILFLGSIK